MARKNPITTCLLFATLTLALPACGPEVPDNPTWEKDIYPLMVSRCIRCHNDPGGIDPLTAKAVPGWGNKVPGVGAMLYNLNFPTLPPPPLPLAFGLLATSVKGLPFPMPPPPAEKLEDWEIDLVVKWSNNKR